MYIPPKALSAQKLPPEKLRPDRQYCTEYEEFGLGDEALYVEYFACARMGYIPLTAIERVYKRLAISKSYYKGNLFHADRMPNADSVQSEIHNKSQDILSSHRPP